MNRLEFIHKLDLPDYDFVTMVITSFDKFMALYSLVGSYDDFKITNNNNISFTVSFDDKEKVVQLQNLITQYNNSIQIYNKIFAVIINNIHDNQIEISIQ